MISRGALIRIRDLLMMDLLSKASSHLLFERCMLGATLRTLEELLKRVLIADFGFQS